MQITEEVRREALEFLTQMKAISDRADTSFAQEEKLHAEIGAQRKEVADWKARYTRTKAALRSLRTSSIGLPAGSANALQEPALVDAAGLIPAAHVTRFQLSIDELLRVARGTAHEQALAAVKHVVMATRDITQAVDAAGEPDPDTLRLKTRVSATANNLTTAAKNHASARGLSPVSLVDAAASHLTASVAELVKRVKMRPQDASAADDDYVVVDDGEDPIVSPESPPRSPKFIAYANGIPNGNGNNHANSHASPPPHSAHTNIDVPDMRVSNGADSDYSPESSPRTSRNRSRNGSAMLGDKIGPESKNWGNDPPPMEFRSEVEELRVGDSFFPSPPSNQKKRYS